jgi:hypothetical protein
LNVSIRLDFRSDIGKSVAVLPVSRACGGVLSEKHTSGGKRKENRELMPVSVKGRSKVGQIRRAILANFRLTFTENFAGFGIKSVEVG